MTWLMFPAGLLISTIAMFSGIGGGVLWMPLLISVYGLPPDQAVVCALLIQVGGMASGTVANMREGLIETRLLWQQAVVAAPAVIVGAALCRVAVPAFIELSLGLLIFLIAYLFLRGGSFLDAGSVAADLEAGRAIRPVSAAGGFLTGFLSIGIGDWLVPLFNKRCRLTMARSVATGVALMLLLSSLGAGAHLLMGGAVPRVLIAVAAPGVIIGAQVGARLHLRLSEVGLKEVFVLLLLTLAAHVTFNSL